MRQSLPIVTCLIGLAWVSTGASWSQDRASVRFEHLTIEEGLSQNTVEQVLQDQRGFMWFGTQDGLNRFDGYRITTYRHDADDPNSLNENVISNLYEDRQGMLWITTRDYALHRYDPTFDHITRFRKVSNDTSRVGHDEVEVVLEDQQGRLWIATRGVGLSRLDAQRKSYTPFQHDPADSTSIRGNDTYFLYEDAKGSIWIGVEGGFLNVFNPETALFAAFHFQESAPQLTNEHVKAIVEDRSGFLWVSTNYRLLQFDAASRSFLQSILYPRGATIARRRSLAHILYVDPEERIWVATDFGLHRYDQRSTTFQSYYHQPNDPSTLSTNLVYALLEDQNRALWIGSNKGLHRYIPETNAFQRYRHDPADPYSLHSDIARDLYRDQAGLIWIGTVGGGVDRFNPTASGFRHLKRDASLQNSLRSNRVLSLVEDRTGTIWIGTTGGGVSRYDPQTHQFEYFDLLPRPATNINPFYSIEALLEDYRGNMWFGLWFGGLARYDRTTGTITRYQAMPDDPARLSSDRVLSLFEDQNNVLWIGTYNGGLSRLDQTRSLFDHFQHNPIDTTSLSNPHVQVLYQDGVGTLWVGTLGGLNRFDPTTQSFQRFTYTPSDSTSLLGNAVYAIQEDQAGHLWIGTSGGLNRFDPTTESFQRFTQKDDLPNDVIYGILMDNEGYLWVSTNRGIAQFDPTTHTVRSYDVDDGLQSNEFIRSAYLKSRTGTLHFGGINGITAFDPERIQDNPYVPPVVLTEFSLFNTPQTVGRDSPLAKAIWATDSLTLNYRDNISFQFAALSYAIPDKNRYRYRLEYYDQQWSEVSSDQRFATYTGLPAGTYTFTVQGSNHSGVWNEASTRVWIHVPAPYWQRTWFMVLLGALGVGLIWGSYRWRMQAAHAQRLRLEQEVYDRTQALAAANTDLQSEIAEHKQTEVALAAAKERAEAANDAKSVFLAMMSHELRTPLNGILGYTQILHRNPSTTHDQRKGLNIIEKSGHHLLALINDILDLTKIETGKEAPHLVSFHLPTLLDEIHQIFQLRAQKQGLAFDVHRDTIPEGVIGDPKWLRQILNNLLDNAIKYTEHGSISFAVTQIASPDAQNLLLRFAISDTGMGIDAAEWQTFLEPFQRGKNNTHIRGTGLGLSICQKLLRHMGSHLELATTPGEGSTLWFDLPLRLDPAWHVATSLGNRRIVGIKNQSPTVLIVDDHAENRMIVVDALTPLGFACIEASNGAVGLQKLETIQPDILLVDLVMPQMDGFTLIRRIRALPEGHDLPIITMSARAFDDDQQRSFAVGSNAFLAKPINIHQLVETLQQLLQLEYDVQPLEAEPARISSSIAPPSRDVLDTLLHLVHIGDIRALLQQAEVLANEEHYHRFSQELERLAKGFQIERIRTWLMSYEAST